MDCKTCGGSEFTISDGISYCTECQSQVEETQTEVAVERTFSRNIHSLRSKKRVTSKKRELSDWITIEGFNHILFMQVSSLINLGASPKLKNSVLHIWSKYLQKSEIAFRIDYLVKEDDKPLLGSRPLKRDLTVLYRNKQISKVKRKRKSYKQISKCKRKLPDESDYEPASNLSGDENLSVEKVGVKKLNKPKYSSYARKLLRKKPTKSFCKKVYDMTLQKTLSICYLGLLYTEDQLSLADLIRLVYEEKVPYLNLLDKLPSTLKLETAGDSLTFLTYDVPDAFSILKTSHEIMDFLQLPEYKEPSFSLAAARIVRDLNLPGDFLSVIKILMERYKERLSHYAVPPNTKNIPTDCQAVAFLLIAMKVLFVLDDKFEIEHSKVMRKLNILHPDRKYFDWKEWKEHSMVKEYLFVCEKSGYPSINNLDSLSANLIILKHPSTHLRSTSEESHNPYAIVPVKHKITGVLSDMVPIPSSNSNIPTSFPLRRAANCYIEEWRTLRMFKETKEIDFTLLKKDFSSCSLSFNPSQFDEVDDELSHLLMTSVYLPSLIVKVRTDRSSMFTNHHEVTCTTSSYWILNYTEKNQKAKSDILNADWFEKLPNSFKWLINFFSKYAYCNNIALYKEVNLMERILFLQKWRIKSGKIKNKINIDF